MRKLLAAVALVLVSALVALAEPAGPFDAYKTYLDAASHATSPEALYPFVSKEFKGILQAAPKDQVDKMIAGNIAKEKLTDLKLMSLKIEGAKAELELKAKTGDGRDTSGKATLVKEDGAWKLDDDAWATEVKQ